MTDELGFSDAADDAETLKDVLDDLERRSLLVRLSADGGAGFGDARRQGAGGRLARRWPEADGDRAFGGLEAAGGAAWLGPVGARGEPWRRGGLCRWRSAGQGDALRRRPISRWMGRWG